MNVNLSRRCLSMLLVLVMLFTMMPTNIIAEELHDHSHEEAVSLVEVEALSVSASASANYVYAGEEAVTVTAKIAGGTAPYTVTLQAVKNGSVVFTDSKTTESKSVQLSYKPASWGDYELVVTAHDELHDQDLTTIALAVAEHDTENEAAWAASVSGASVSSDWAKSLVSVAKTQVGYEESEKDFVIKSGEKQGYSRYGAWFGTPYTGWNTAFLAFVAEYAKVPNDALLSGSNYRSWVNGMSAKGAYMQAGYTPKAGDIAFLSGSRVALVESVSGSNVTVIEGDVNGAVVRKTYAISKVAGFGNTELMQGLRNGTATAVPTAVPEATKAPEGGDAPVVTAAPTATPVATPIPEDEELVFQATPTPGPGVTAKPKEDSDPLTNMGDAMDQLIGELDAAATAIPMQFSEAYYLMQAEMNALVEKYMGTATPTKAEIEAFVEGLELQELYYIIMEFDELEDYAKEIGFTEYEGYALNESESSAWFAATVYQKWISLTDSRATKNYNPINGESDKVIVTVDNSSSDKLEADNSKLTVTAKGSGGFLGIGARPRITTITIKNSSSTTATISFDWTTTSVNNITTIDGAGSKSGTYSKAFAAGEEIKIVITTAENSTENKLVMSNFTFVEAQSSAQVVFEYDERLGSITVAGGTMVSGSSYAVDTAAGVALTATPADGVVFLGWLNAEDHSVLSTAATYTLTPANDMTVIVAFAQDGGTPWWGVGGTNRHTYFNGIDLGIIKTGTEYVYYKVNPSYIFDDFDEACAVAQNHATAKVVVMLSSGTLSGDKTIPAGVTVLVPFEKDENGAYTLYTDSPCSLNGSYTTPTAYCTLTLAQGATLTINGTLSISARHVAGNTNADGNGNAGAPFGPVGWVKLSADSQIINASGGKLFAWGYITGSGTVTAKSGSETYEYFQFTDFRGGTATSSMATSYSHRVFPLSQYYVQNIESKMTIQAGATEYCYTSIYMSSSANGALVPFIGSSNNMFKLTGGSVTKWYNGAEDRLMVELNAGSTMSVSPISMGISSINMNSENYVLPINSNITLTIEQGSNITISQDVLMQPGSRIIIREGAVCKLAQNSSFYIMDKDQWGGYVGSRNSKFIPLVYAPGRTYTRTEEDLVDVSIQLDGTLLATYVDDNGKKITGYVYSSYDEDVTMGGANIFSTGTGKIVIKAGMATSVNQVTQGGNDGTEIIPVAIPVTPAMLKNADGSYTKTGEKPTDLFSDTNGTAFENGDDTYKYDKGVWQLWCTDDAHVYTRSELIEQSCTEGGHYIYNCKCEATKDLKVYNTVESTDENGETIYVPQTGKGHTYERTGEGYPTGGVKTAPTCTVDGYITYTCGDPACTAETQGHTKTVRPSDYASEDEMPDEIRLLIARGHKPGEDVIENNKAATCTAEGSFDTVVYCTVETCKAVISRETTTVPALGHTYDAGALKAPSCTENGTLTFACTVCTDEATVENGGIVVITYGMQTTLTGKAKEAYDKYCEVHGFSPDSLKAKDHTFNRQDMTGTVILEESKPTCTKPSYKKVKCGDCGAIETQEGTTTLGHTYLNGNEETQFATCKADGYILFTCEVCEQEDGYEFRVEWNTTDLPSDIEEYLTMRGIGLADLKQKEHTTEVIPPVAPTCTQNGTTAGEKCTACNTVTQEPQIDPATGHKYETSEEPRSCTLPGSITYTCSVCAEKVETEREEGWTATITPETEVADLYLQIREELPEGFDPASLEARGHIYVSNYAPPTCKEPGSYTFTCDCGDKQEITVNTTAEKLAELLKEDEIKAVVGENFDPSENLKAKGHDWSDWETMEPATCTDKGREERSCTQNCGEEGATETKEIPALGHTYGEGVYDARNCEKDGTITFTCSACEASEANEGVVVIKHNTQIADLNEKVQAAYNAYVAANDGFALDQLKAEGHNYQRTDSMLPSCEVKGTITYTCENEGCPAAEVVVTYPEEGETSQQLFDRLDADIQENLKDATTIEALKAWEHEYAGDTIAPTCEHDGYIMYTCPKCNNSFTEGYDGNAQLSHNYVVTATPSTSCTENGTISISCDRGCNFEHVNINPADYEEVSAEWPEEAKKAVEESGKLDAAIGDHDFEDVAFAWQTCTESGYFVYECQNNNCSERVVVTYLTDYDSLHETIKADPNLDADVIALLKPTGHEFDSGVPGQIANCAYEGTIVYTCENVNPDDEECGYTYTLKPSTYEDDLANNRIPAELLPIDAQKLEELKKLDHQYRIDVAEQPGCITQGKLTVSCDQGCGYTDTFTPDEFTAGVVGMPEIVKEKVSERGFADVIATGHQYTSVTTAPTCEADGYIVKTCGVCAEDVKDHQVRVDYDATSDDPVIKALAATGHNYTCTYTAPNCEDDGQFVFICTNPAGEETCGEIKQITKATESAELDELLQNKQIDDAVKKEFPENFAPATDLDPLGHQWDNGDVTQYPTCTEKGEKIFTCSRETGEGTCGKTRTVDVDPTGHNYSKVANSADNKPANCTESGVVVFQCGNSCQGIVKVEYSEDGYAKLDSTITDELTSTEYDALKPTGHLNTHEEDQKNPTCQAVGYEKGVFCDDCQQWVSGHAEIGKVDHAYPEKNVNATYYTAPTCLKDGYWTLTCIYNCGLGTKTEVHADSATNHADKVYHKQQDATCTVNGYTEGHFCQACENLVPGTGWIEGHQVITASGHVFTRTEQQRTCEADGFITFDCDNCDLSYVITPDNFDEMKADADVDQQVKTALEGMNISAYAHIGHDWMDTDVQPVCEVEGSITYDCDNCDPAYTITPSNYETIVLPAEVKAMLDAKYVIANYIAREHNWTAWADDPNATATCTEDGKEIRSCQYADCQKPDSRDKAALGHTYMVDGVLTGGNVTQFECEKAVITEYTCTRTGCTEPNYTHVGDVLKHDIKHEIAVPATCVSNGEAAHTWCQREGCTYTEGGGVILALGHTYKDKDGNWVEECCTESKEPTCTAAGYKVYTCDRDGCTETTEGHVSEQIPVAALGHEWTFVRTEPKCEEDGMIVYTCGRTDCEVKTYTLTPETYDATQVPTGIEVDEALVNGLKKTEHPYKRDVGAVDPGCETVGYTKGVYCPECQKYIDGGHQEIPANGHAWTSVTTKPTCTEPGYITYTCTVTDCDGKFVVEHDIDLNTAVLPKNLEVTSEEVAALAQHVPASRTIAANCYANAYTEEYCSVEGEGKCTYYKKTDIPGTQRTHLTTVFVKTVAPSCVDEKQGYDVYECEYEDCEFTEEKNHMPWNHTHGNKYCTEDQICTVCGDVVNAAPGHDYEQTGTVAKTCTTDGKIIFTCKGEHCGAETKVVTVTYGDSYAELDADIKGLLGSEEAIEDLKATDHNWNDGEITTEATCTEAGERTYTCENDGTHTRKEPIEATGHAYAQTNVQAATCLENGILTFTCENTLCGEATKVVTVTYGDSYAELDEDIKALLGSEAAIEALKATDHKWDAGKITTEATCTEAGERTYTCENDGTHTRKETVEATGHAYKQTNVQAATCLEHGILTFTCENTLCGEATKVVTVTYGDSYAELDEDIKALLGSEAAIEALKATDHKWDAGKLTTEATCTEAGERTYTCENDGTHTRKETVEATGHAYKQTATTAKTCLDHGTITFNCQNDKCGSETKVVTVTYSDDYSTVYRELDKSIQTALRNALAIRNLKATGHSYTETVTQPTCTSEGYTTYDCKNCEYSYVDDYKAVIEHSYTSEVLKASTCKEPGTIKYTCGACGHSYEESLPLDPVHKYVTMPDVKPTCTETGTKGGQQCSVCGKILDSNKPEPVPATGHTYGCTYTAPTCVGDGVYTFICQNGTCGDKQEITVNTTAEELAELLKEDEIAAAVKANSGENFVPAENLKALGHDIVIDEAKAPTCTEDGLKAGQHCTRCDAETIEQDVDPALGHKFSAEETGKDCIEGRICERCNQPVKASAEHKWNDGVVSPAPTCTSEGVKTFTCTVCADTYTESVDKIPHPYKAVVTEPTCEEDGYTTFTCSSCGDTYTDDVVAATGHAWGEPVVTPNTCGKDGYTTKTCSVCETVVTYDKTTATGEHTYGDWVETKAPTCTEEGVKQQTCTVCGNVATGTVEMKEHLNDITIDAIAPECGKVGWTEGKQCSACGQTTVMPEVVKALQHNWVAYDYKAPTCTEDGNANNGSYCTLCGAVDAAATVLPATNHKNKAPGEAKAPTCTEVGNTAGVYCPDCQTWLEVQEDIPATDHENKAPGEAKAPTCTEVGNTAGVYCPDCQTWLEEQAEIPATDHENKAPGEAKAPTCTEAGNTAGVYCPDCQTWLEEQEAIEPTGHKMDEGVEDPKHTCTTAGVMTYTCLNGCGLTETEEVFAAHTPEVIPAVPHTCTEDGLTEGSKCAVCDEILVAQKVDPAAHTWEDVTIHKEATCLEDGSKDVRCIAAGCDVTDTIVVPALGHTVVIDPAKAATCTVDGLTEGKHCSVCEAVLVAQEAVKAAHTWSTAPCTNVNAICIRCGKTNGEELLMHNMADATCTKPATCTYTGCDYTEGEALGHKLVDIDEIPVTCEEPGWSTGVQCTVCGVYTVTPKLIPAINHKNSDGSSAIVKYPAKNPTYTSEGWYEYEACGRCTYTTKKIREKLPEPSIDTYAELLKYLPKLEEWAVEYAKVTPGTDPVDLVIKYIRTGVERYNSGSWGIMAGYEDPGFAKYVAEQEDLINSAFTEEEVDQMLQVSGLKNLKLFTLPNDPNFKVDFGHMFGTMDITYNNYGSVNHADVGGWSGDLVDLLSTSDHSSHQDLIKAAGDDFEELVTVIRTKLLGYDFDHEDTFALNDFYGDLDAFYLMEKLDVENYAAGDMAKLFESYFTVALDDVARADFLLVNRFDDVRTRSAIREAVYTAYTTNSVISTLEGTREFNNTPDLITRRKAVCYAFADYLCILAGDWVDDTDNPYLTDYESSYSLLAPGISMEIHKATSADNKNMVYYLGYADLAREDVDIMVNYHDRYVDEGWNMSRVLDQANKAADKYYANPESEHYIENFAPVVAVNGAGFDMGTGEPGGLMVMHGFEYHGPNNNGFFGITKSGKAVIGTTKEYNEIYKGQLEEGIAGFGSMLVENGELSKQVLDMLNNPNYNYYNDRASRTAVGITETGRVVFMVLDGRQEPWSCGGSMIEIAQIMKLAGCKVAVNLDGGGSTTFVARQAGDEELSLVNRPSDGVQRSVSTSLMMYSTAPSSKTFEEALIASNYNFMTVGAEVSVSATGLSATNNIVALPEGAYWAVSDPEMADIVDTGEVKINPDDPETKMKRTAKVIAKKSGEVEVCLMLDGVEVGSKTLSVIVPDQIYFTRDKIDGIYGQGVELPLKARYQGKEAAFVAEDINFVVSNPAVGEMTGLTFNVVENSTVKTVSVAAVLKHDEKVNASIDVVLYKDGENNFNFDNATGGSRELAWLREVSNAKMEGASTYYIINPDEDMVTSYTVALDMSQIPIPEQLESLTYMLPGADMEGASAWTFLLQLAERMSELTTVSAEFQIDPNLEIVGYDAQTGVLDTSGITVLNEYFLLDTKEGIVYDPQKNILTLKLHWDGSISQAVDPAIANPMCIVSGLKLVPKAGAAWDAKDRLIVVNTADIGYRVYLRANALHTFASKPENQKTFGLYPYGPYTNSRNVLENGGYFESTYATFKDSYTLVKSLKNGWVVEDGGFRYYIDGQYLTGIHFIEGDMDPEVKGLYYQFDSKGINIGQTPYTGKHVMDGKTYYMQNGKPFKGWITLDDGKWYLFNWNTGAGIHGSYTEAFIHEQEDGTSVTNNVVYEFENGRLLDGVWYQDHIGWRYYYGPFYYKQGWQELTTQDGQKNGTGEKAMFFFEEFYAQDHTSPVQEAHATVEYWYEFNDKGELLGNASTGLYWWDDDWHHGEGYGEDAELYYVVERLDGTEYSLNVEDGLHYIDGDYYFFDLWTGRAHRNKSYYIHAENTNGLPLAENWYRFDNEGRIIMFTGVVKEDDGNLYYYYNGGRRYGTGLIEFEGHIYGVSSTAQCYVNQSVQIDKVNGLVKETGVYRFDENGHLIQGEALVNENGTLYYYNAEGKRVENAGLIKYGGDIYYIGEYTVGGTTHNTGSAIARDVEINVAKDKTNGLLPAGTYRFDEDGKAILTTELVEGNDGKLYYYMNGALQKGAGMIKYEDAYYFIDANGAAVTNKEMLIEKPIAPFPADTYEFGEDGKMIIREGIYEGYYYVSGIKTAAGLVEENGKYYFAAEGGKIVTDTKYDVQKTNGKLPAGIYRIDKNGALNLTTELADEDGKLVYYYEGKLAANEGLVQIDGDYYYIGENGIALTDAKQKITNNNGLKLTLGTYRFGKDGKAILTTELVEEADGKLYYYVQGRMADKAALIEYEGNYYWVEVNGFVVTSTKISLGNGEKLPTGIYRVGADGKIILTTELVNENGHLTYYKNGILTKDAGLIQLNGSYYYIDDSGYAVVDGKYSVIKHNNLKPAGTYRFAEDGKMILTTELVEEADGKLYYYIDGRLSDKADLIKYEDDFYWIQANGCALTDAKIDVSENKLLAAGTYRVGEDAKVILTTEVVKESDGKYYYYENGKLGKDAGLVAYNNAYYYIDKNGTAVTDTEIDVEKTNGLLPEGIYRFDEDGKADLTTELVKAEDGKLYFYVNGALAEDAGLVEYEGSYYYITADGSAVTGKEMLVEKPNGLFPVDTYEFGADGKMVIREGIYEGYYYVGGVKTEAGLVKVGEDYYYAGEGGKLATDAKVEVEKTNGLKDAGIYRFDENGKMIQANGIVAEGDKYFYYVEGKLTEDAGLIKYEDSYYYITADGSAVTGKEMLVEKTNGLFPVDTYEFGADGKMVIREGIYEGYYFVGGVKTEAGLVKVGEDYYYAGEGGKLVTSAKVEVEKTNGLKDAGIYRFDENGKMIQKTEIVEESGKLYYYESGKLGKDAGLVKVGEDYYYIGEDGTAVTNVQMLVEKTNDLLPEGLYCFGEDGKMFERLAGDANEDGIVDLEDTMLVFEYGAGEDVKINLINANVNGDAVVDAQDALLLMQYNAGWDIELQ